MRDLTAFGGKTHPLRCSSLPLLCKCPWRAVMLFADLTKDDSGAAADTGSATHHAVEHWHKHGDTAAALLSVRSALADFPLADLDEVGLHFTPYTLDPRNAPHRANLVAMECKVEFSLSPHDSDPTGEPIYVTGTLDQLRRGPDGRVYLWDLKTGKPDGWEMIHEYALQLAAYCVGASTVVGEPVHPGGIIRSRGWRVRGCNPALEPGGVFFHATFGLEHCDWLLDRVRLVVASIRAGELTPGPGGHCNYCPAGGLTECLSILNRAVT